MNKKANKHYTKLKKKSLYLVHKQHLKASLMFL